MVREGRGMTSAAEIHVTMDGIWRSRCVHVSSRYSVNPGILPVILTGALSVDA